MPSTTTHPGAPALDDHDVLEAMRAIPGYLDITVEDFRTLYRLAREHALERTFRQVRAAALMRTGIEPLAPGGMLDRAARSLVGQGLKALPVVDPDGRPLGMLTESDFLRRLGAGSFLGLMLALMEDRDALRHRCHQTPVSAAMSSPAVSVPEQAGFGEIAAAFRTCPGRSLPVVGADGRLRGLLLRKDFVTACGTEPGS